MLSHDSQRRFPPISKIWCRINIPIVVHVGLRKENTINIPILRAGDNSEISVFNSFQIPHTCREVILSVSNVIILLIF